MTVSNSSPCLIAALAILSGCSDRTGALAVGDAEAPQAPTARGATIDFTAVRMGTTVHRRISVWNTGGGPLTLVSLEQTGGTPVGIAEAPAGGTVWSVSFLPGMVIPPGESLELDASFRPPVTDAASVLYEAHLLLTAEDTASDSGTATLTLLGSALACDGPPAIEFGAVDLEDTGTALLMVTNPAHVPATVVLGQITSDGIDHQHFALAVGAARQFVLVPGATRAVPITFTPAERRTYLAALEFSPSTVCGAQSVELRGDGVDEVLSWAPSTVEFLWVTPGVQAIREVTFINQGSVDVELSGIKVENVSEFGILAGTGVDATALTVPAKRTATLTVWCKPAELGPRQTPLSFTTNLPKQPEGTILMKAYAGGPDIEVQPHPTMNFGKVAYFADAHPPVFQKKKLLVVNVGTTFNPPRNDANLRLGRVDGAGNIIPDTYFTVTPLNAETTPNEFTVTMPQGYDPQKGLEAKAGLNTAELFVTFTPTSLGLKQAEITIYSNDGDESEVTVTVSADAIELPPCNYSVTPTTLAFGLISPPDYRDLGFTVKNNGSNPGDICLLSGLDLGPGTNGYFTLPTGPIDNAELEPGASAHVLVRVWPQWGTPATVTTITGQVDFYMSSPLLPQRTVPLQAQVGPSCLTIAPDELGYGTVQLGCSSATKTFSMYNTCGSPVTVNGFRILSAPITDPACLSTSGCEFLLTASPAIPTGGLPINVGSAPTTFQVKYRPQDSGSDADVVAISATQNGTNVTYLVPISGRGDAQGIHTDTWVQEAKPKSDILMVVDNSSSMSQHQQSLAANFVSFIKYAVAKQVDFHIAVIHADPSLSDYQKFVYGPGHPEKVLGSTTADVENKFKAKVNVGTTGSGRSTTAAALGALTAPLVNSDNAGFLRPGASLSVVVVTDGNDTSPSSATYYLNGFWNIKGFNRKTEFTYNAIASFDPSCPSVQDSGEYAFYVAQTNGVKESICTPDWAKALENLGKFAFGFRTDFFLTSAPDLTKGQIAVKIDGVLVPPVSTKGAPIWTFDSIANSVNFEPYYVPEPGQTLAITYATTCYP